MNKAMLVGRLTKDPEMRSFNNGGSVTNFTVAINRPFKNREGNYDADFINVQVTGRQAESTAKYLSKGSLVGVEGRISTRSYDAQDGSKRYVTEVAADRVEFLSSKKEGNSGDFNVSVDSTYEYSPGMVDMPSPEMGIDVPSEDPFKDFGNEVSLSDDDLPF